MSFSTCKFSYVPILGKKLFSSSESLRKKIKLVWVFSSFTSENPWVLEVVLSHLPRSTAGQLDPPQLVFGSGTDTREQDNFRVFPLSLVTFPIHHLHVLSEIHSTFCLCPLALPGSLTKHSVMLRLTPIYLTDLVPETPFTTMPITHTSKTQFMVYCNVPSVGYCHLPKAFTVLQTMGLFAHCTSLQDFFKSWSYFPLQLRRFHLS